MGGGGLWQGSFGREYLTSYCHSHTIFIIEDCETASNGFEYQFNTGKPLKIVKLNLNYYENGSNGKKKFHSSPVTLRWSNEQANDVTVLLAIINM